MGQRGADWRWPCRSSSIPRSPSVSSWSVQRRTAIPPASGTPTSTSRRRWPAGGWSWPRTRPTARSRRKYSVALGPDPGWAAGNASGLAWLAHVVVCHRGLLRRGQAIGLYRRPAGGVGLHGNGHVYGRLQSGHGLQGPAGIRTAEINFPEGAGLHQQRHRRPDLHRATRRKRARIVARHRVQGSPVGNLRLRPRSPRPPHGYRPGLVLQIAAARALP